MTTVNPELRPPLQERTRRAWQRILDAGLELLEDHGFDGVTIAALCKRAQVTPPTIYARAASKEALLLALYEHALERISLSDTLDPSDPHWAELETERVIPEAVEVVSRIWLENAALMRALVKRSGVDVETFRRGSSVSIDLARRFRVVLLARADVVRGADAEERVDACFRIVYSAMVQRVMFGDGFESDLPLSDERLQAALTVMVAAYLQAS